MAIDTSAGLPPWEEAFPEVDDEPAAEQDSGLTLSCSVSWKKQVNQYEPAEVFVNVSGIRATTSLREIEEMADEQARIAVDAITASLKKRMTATLAQLRQP